MDEVNLDASSSQNCLDAQAGKSVSGGTPKLRKTHLPSKMRHLTAEKAEMQRLTNNRNERRRQLVHVQRIKELEGLVTLETDTRKNMSKQSTLTRSLKFINRLKYGLQKLGEPSMMGKQIGLSETEEEMKYLDALLKERVLDQVDISSETLPSSSSDFVSDTSGVDTGLVVQSQSFMDGLGNGHDLHQRNDLQQSKWQQEYLQKEKCRSSNLQQNQLHHQERHLAYQLQNVGKTKNGRRNCKKSRQSTLFPSENPHCDNHQHQRQLQDPFHQAIGNQLVMTQHQYKPHHQFQHPNLQQQLHPPHQQLPLHQFQMDQHLLQQRQQPFIQHQPPTQPQLLQQQKPQIQHHQLHQPPPPNHHHHHHQQQLQQPLGNPNASSVRPLGDITPSTNQTVAGYKRVHVESQLPGDRPSKVQATNNFENKRLKSLSKQGKPNKGPLQQQSFDNSGRVFIQRDDSGASSSENSPKDKDVLQGTTPGTTTSNNNKKISVRYGECSNRTPSTPQSHPAIEHTTVTNTSSVLDVVPHSVIQEFNQSSDAGVSPVFNKTPDLLTSQTVALKAGGFHSTSKSADWSSQNENEIGDLFDLVGSPREEFVEASDLEPSIYTDGPNSNNSPSFQEPQSYSSDILDAFLDMFDDNEIP